MIFIKITILACLLISNFALGAQQNLNSSGCILSYEKFESRELYEFVDSMPKYPGGIETLMKFIFDNVSLPEEVGCMAGKIIVQFVIDTNGTVLGKKILRGFNDRVNTAILNVIDKMPNWLPGKCEGNTVPVIFVLPINITLQ